MKRPLVFLFIALLSGILVSYLFEERYSYHIKQSYLLLVFIFFFIILCLPAKHKYKEFVVCILFFILGMIFAKYELTKESRLLPYTRINDYIVLEGIVLEPVYINNRGMGRFRCRIKKIITRNKDYLVAEDIILHIYKYRSRLMLNPGDRIRFLCKLKEIKNFQNPGAFDYKSYMKRKGITCKGYVKDGRYVVFMGKESLPFPYNIVEPLKSPIRDFFKNELSHNDFGIFSAIILGERRNLDSDIKEIINKAGLGHILAVSGLHVGLVAWISFMLVKWLILTSYRVSLTFNPKKVAAIITIIPVMGYCLISGFRLPTQRAMIMVFVFLFSVMLDRQDDIVSSLCLAGLIILSIFPLSVFSPSFQLSFIAVAGIILIMPDIRRYILKIINPAEHKNIITKLLLPYFVDLFSVSISALIVLVPFILYYFHRVPLLSIPANFTTIPILGLWIIPICFFSLSLLLFSYKAAALLLKISASGLHIMLSLIRFWADIPCSSIWLFQPNIWEIILYYGLIFFIIKRAYKYRIVGMMAIFIVIIFEIVFWASKIRFNKDLRITFLDAGKGTCALIEFPKGKRLLIDGGGFSPDFNVARMVISPFLWYSRILKIHYILLIHPKGNHMSDIGFIKEVFGAKILKRLNTKIDEVVISTFNKEIPCEINYKGISIIFLKKIKGLEKKIKNHIVVLLPYVKDYNRLKKIEPKICIISGYKGKRIDGLKNKVYYTKDGAIQIDIKGKDKIKIKRYAVHDQA